MKKFIIFLLIFCLLSSQALPVSAQEAGQNSTIPTETLPETSISTNSCHGLNATSAWLGVGKLVKNVRAAFLYESNSDTLMYEMNSDSQMYPASLVKIMTALLVVENGNADDMVTVSEAAVNSIPHDAVSADLVAGEALSVKDLLHCMLVDSANDAASVLAEYVSGNQENFVSLMNTRAAELGCLGTNFVNVHGLHDDAQFTTARDVARILSEAIKNPNFMEAFSATKYVVSATNMSEERELKTGNYMLDPSSKLYYDNRVLGGRTGVTDDGRRCFAAVSESNGMCLVSVVMGTESVYQEDGYTAITIGGFKETTALLDAGFQGYKTAQILYPNQILKQCNVIDGNSDVILGSQVSVSSVLPEDVNASDLKFQYIDETIQAPIVSGQKLSTVQIWYGSMCIAQTDLYAMNSVDHVNKEQTIQNEVIPDNKFPTIVVVILCVVSLCVGVVLAIRFANQIKGFAANLRSRRYRRSRRRSK